MDRKTENLELFGPGPEKARLPEDYCPKRPEFFRVDRIALARGSNATEERQSYISGICALYPDAEIVECYDVPHNRIDLGEKDPLRRSDKGKSTLVFGEHKSAVRFSSEEENTCPNYWHFSPWGFCFYGCQYCYLAGTPTFWHSPAVKVFLNLPEILKEIDRAAHKTARPVAFYLGKLQDGLALDPLTGYSEVLVPFFANHEYARMTLLTKSADVRRLLELPHRGHTVLSWSVNPPAIASRFEENVPKVEDRLRAMERVSDKGYPVRAVMMPLIPVPGRREYYREFTRELLSRVPLQRLTLGGICIYGNAGRLLERKLERGNAISRGIAEGAVSEDGRARYSEDLRLEMYESIMEAARQVRPDLDIALCLEETRTWEKLGLEENLGRCNCVW
ncbi:MAG: radical SAM protein [bacterium]